MPEGSRPIRYTNEGVDLPTIYSNNVETMVSPWDIRFRFGQIDHADDTELAIKNTVVVYMALDHARLFAAKIVESLEKFEELRAKAQKQ